MTNEILVQRCWHEINTQPTRRNETILERSSRQSEQAWAALAATKEPREGTASGGKVKARVRVDGYPELLDLSAEAGSLRGKSDAEAKAAFGAALTAALHEALAIWRA